MIWTESQLQYLIDNYSSKSVSDISNHLNRSVNSVYKKASDLKLSHLEYNRSFMSVKSRKYSINHNAFNKIDNEQGAYFLGLLYADGYNQHDKGNVMLELIEKDKDILEEFNKFLGSNRPLYEIKNIENEQRRYRLSFTSMSICYDLANYGCMQNKTFKIKFPDFLDSNLSIHFIRGYFDGDGSIVNYFFNKDTYRCFAPHVSIAGNDSFILGMKNFIDDLFPSMKAKIIKDKRVTSISYLRIHSLKNVIVFLDLIYYNASVYFNRKHEVYRKLKYCKEMSLRGNEIEKVIRGKI
jgi:hypothetical protein